MELKWDFFFVIKMSPSQRGAWLWPFLCGARAIWMHRGLWQAEVSVHGQRLVMETIWETAVNPEAKRTPVLLVLHGIHHGAPGQRPDFRLGQWLLNLRRCRMHEWINRQIYTSINLHLACLSTDDESKILHGWVSSKLEQTRTRRTISEQMYQLQHLPVGYYHYGFNYCTHCPR